MPSQAFLDEVAAARVQLVASDLLHVELGRSRDEARRIKTVALLNLATLTVSFDPQMAVESERLRQYGLGLYDALHLILAEKAGATLLTVDDRLVRRASTIPGLQVTVENPIDWLRRRKPWLIKR